MGWAMLDEPALRSRYRRLDAEGFRVVADDSGRCSVFGASENGYRMVARLGDERRDSIFEKARSVCRGRVVRTVPIGDRRVSAALVGIPITLGLTGTTNILEEPESANAKRKHIKSG